MQGKPGIAAVVGVVVINGGGVSEQDWALRGRSRMQAGATRTRPKDSGGKSVSHPK